jgi:hypothetical protein
MAMSRVRSCCVEFLLALRLGKFIGNYGGAATPHLLMWSNIWFLKWCGDDGGGYVEMVTLVLRYGILH